MIDLLKPALGAQAIVTKTLGVETRSMMADRRELKTYGLEMELQSKMAD